MGRTKHLVARAGSAAYYGYVRLERRYLLPLSTTPEKPRIRLRTLLGHCLYRRVLIWSAAALLVLFVSLIRSAIHQRDGGFLFHDDFRIHRHGDGVPEHSNIIEAADQTAVLPETSSGSPAEPSVEENIWPPWRRFPQYVIIKLANQK